MKSVNKVNHKVRATMVRTETAMSYEELVDKIGVEWERGRNNAIRAVNIEYVQTKWRIGRYIVEFEQHGHARAIIVAAEMSAPADNPPIGIVLGSVRDQVVVEYAMRGITNRIFVSRYQLYLPDKEQLKRELAYAIEAEEGRHVAWQSAKRKGGGK